MLKATRKKPRATAAPPPAPTPAKPSDQEGSLKHALLGWYGVVGLTLSYILPFRFPFAESYAKDYWRHALGSLLLVLALVAGLIGTALYLFDANDFKAQIVEYVKLNKQRDLQIDGDIHVAFFPKLGLDTGKMTLSQRNSTRKFASVDNARLYVAWWPLLRRELQVERIVFDGLHANVVRHKDGSTNFDDLVGAASQFGDMRFELDRIRVLTSSMHVQDEMTGQALSLHDVEVETGRLADASSGKVAASFRLESSEPRIDARVRLEGHLQYDRASQRYDMADLQLQVQGEAAGFTELQGSVRGALSAQPAAGQFTLSNANASLNARLEERPLEAKLTAANLRLNHQRWRGTAVTFDTRLLGADGALSARFELPMLEADDKALKSEAVAFQLGLEGEGRGWQGQFKSPLVYDRDNRQLELATLDGHWSLSHPLLALKLQAPATGKFAAQWPTHTARLDFDTRLDDTRLGGHVKLQDFKAPAWTFDITADSLDLDRYLASDWARRAVDPAQPLELGRLQALNLRGRVRAESLTLARLRLQELSAELRATPTALGVDVLQARLYGGSWQGSTSLAPAEPARLAAQHKLHGVQLDALLADLQPGDARISGQGNLAVEVTAEGASLVAMRTALKGSASLSLARGSIAGLQLGDALVAGKELLGVPGAERSDTTRLTESTAFGELRATFDIGRGNAQSTDLLLKSPLLSARGELEISLDSGDLEANLATTVASGLRRSAAGDLAELSGIHVPLRLIGPWGSATVTYQLGQATGGNVPRLAKANLSRVAAAPATDKPATAPAAK